MLIEHSIYGFRITSGNVGRMPGQITDFTAPLFFVALIWSWYERIWWAWFLAFVLGTFNRETTLALLPLAFSLSPVAGIATAATWAAIKLFLSWWMPGALGMHQFIANIAYLGTDIADPLAGLRYLAELVIGGVLPFFGVRLALRDKRLRFVLLAFPLYWAAIAVFGCIPELRVYNELSVVTAVLFALHFGKTDSQTGA